MKYCITFLLIVCICFFAYSKNKNPKFSFENDSDGLIIFNEESEYSFTAKAPREVEGQIMNVSHKKRGPFEVFCGTFHLVWGDAAIELATMNSNEESVEELSEEAQGVLREQGCAAKYLNTHSDSIVAVASNIEIDKALRATEEGDYISLEGYDVSLDFIEYEGNSMEMKIPNIVCITNAVINEEEYGE